MAEYSPPIAYWYLTKQRKRRAAYLAVNPSFTPLSLFGAGEGGAWYDISDASTLFQDLAGTVPVTADGQPVGMVRDKSGNNNHLVAASTAARPIYHQAGGKYWLQSDGVDDIIRVNFTLAQTWQRIAAFRPLAWVANARIMSGGSAVANAALFQTGVSPQLALFDGTISTPVGGAAIGSDVIITEQHSGATSSLQINSGTPVVSNSGTGAASGQAIFAANGGSGAFFATMYFYGAVVRSGTMTASQISNVKAFLAKKAGVQL